MTKVSRNLRNFFFFHEIPPILKLEVGFFSTNKKKSHIFQKTQHLFHLNFISVNLQKNQRTFFSHKIPPILEVEVGFFSVQKFSGYFFQKTQHLFHLNFISVNLQKNQRTFFSHSSSFRPLASLAVGRGGASQLGARAFRTHSRAAFRGSRAAFRGTSLHSCVQKKASYLWVFQFFFPENTPNFEILSWSFFHLKKFLRFFAGIS